MSQRVHADLLTMKSQYQSKHVSRKKRQHSRDADRIIGLLEEIRRIYTRLEKNKQYTQLNLFDHAQIKIFELADGI